MNQETKLKEVIEYVEERGYKLPENISLGIEAFKILPSLIYYIIFSHDFLKAVFGEGEERGINFRGIGHDGCHLCSGTMLYEDISWKKHAKRMVLEEDPLTYVYNYVQSKK